jgi:hypothetical protein
MSADQKTVTTSERKMMEPTTTTTVTRSEHTTMTAMTTQVLMSDYKKTTVALSRATSLIQVLMYWAGLKMGMKALKERQSS